MSFNILSDVAGWIQGHTILLFEGLGLWIVTLVATIAAVRYYLVAIPPDHFAKGHEPLAGWRFSHPALRWTVLITKNAIGALVVLMGLIMLVTPGPGWLALLFGLALIDLPGKRTLERKIIQRPTLLHFVNHVRTKAGQPELVFTLESHSAHA
jgi:hypothetical protein